MDTDLNTALRADPVRSQAIGERIPSGRWGAAEDVAGAVVFLASAAAHNIHGHMLSSTEGGWRGERRCLQAWRKKAIPQRLRGKIAIITGAGSWGRQHARVFAERPDAELCAIVGRTAERTQRRAAEFGTRAYIDRLWSRTRLEDW